VSRKKVPKERTAPPGGWPARGKTPVLAAVDEVVKQPVLNVDDPEVLSRRLVWRFNEVDKAGPWPPAHIGPSEFGDLLEKMASFESMTVGAIFAPGVDYGKKYQVENLPAQALARLVEIEKDDETEVSRLRLSGKRRLYGFLREHVFHVLWWDPQHEVYPSAKKHT
jgi:hypothetical protein